MLLLGLGLGGWRFWRLVDLFKLRAGREGGRLLVLGKTIFRFVVEFYVFVVELLVVGERRLAVAGFRICARV